MPTLRTPAYPSGGLSRQSKDARHFLDISDMHEVQITEVPENDDANIIRIDFPDGIHLVELDLADAIAFHEAFGEIISRYEL